MMLTVAPPQRTFQFQAENLLLTLTMTRHLKRDQWNLGDIQS